MIGQTLSAIEGLCAKRADKRLFQGTTLVSLKRRQPGKLILTQRAHVDARLLQAVLTHVSVKSVLVRKLSPTVCAFVKLLSGVTSRMCDEAPKSSKTFTTLRTKVRFGVSQVVSVHQTLQSK